MGIIEEINSLKVKATIDGSLSDMVGVVIKKYHETRSSPSGYYVITQLVNPINEYHSKLHDVPTPEKLGRKFARGKQLHNFAGRWFKNLPDFIDDERTFDGKWAGIDRVRGRVDFLMQDSIFEFKTKERIPINEDEVFTLFPQDLEQLAFYSVMLPSKPKINYLVFMEDQEPYSLRAFRVEIKNEGRIIAILKSRIGLLDEALTHQNPSSLGKCRYYQLGCKFSEGGLCSCVSANPIDISAIRQSLMINDDPDFAQRLVVARDTTEKRDFASLTAFDLIAPRKRFIKTVLEIESEYQPDPVKEEYKACLWTVIDDLKRTYDINPNANEIRQIKESLQDSRMRLGFRWIKYIKSGAPDKIVPYIFNINKTKDKRNIKQPLEYHVAELGIVCGLSHKKAGVIFSVFPNFKNMPVAYEVVFSNEKELFNIVKKNLDIVETSDKQKSLELLPECPDYFCPKKTGREECFINNKCFPD